MLFAIVDIETTGGHAAAAGITEIAIITSDGQEVLNSWKSLVNPLQPIPGFIQQLTGIKPEMLAGAPSFAELAAHVHTLLQDKIFVAHNVNFDYSFIKYQLAQCGFDLHNRKLCTVRLARKVFPGLRRYSLGPLCHLLGIPHEDQHRAYGDAAATSLLFSKLFEADTEKHWAAMIKGRNREQYLPPNLPVEQLDNLPETPGVYYFYNAKGQVIYVGKALNLLKRVKGHFANNKGSKQKADFLRDIYRLSFRNTATELMAQILESTEIRKLWPIHNRSQRGFHPKYALYSYKDRQGFLRLGIERHNPRLNALHSFNTIAEGQEWLRLLSDRFQLCLRLCGLAKGANCAQGNFAEGCPGLCCSSDGPERYNVQVQQAMQWIAQNLPTLALIDIGRTPGESSCILMEAGAFKGMGYFNKVGMPVDLEAFKALIEPMSDNDFIRGHILREADRFPEKRLILK
ncbi:MAG: GIY-YIG nuclease family protein [Bacteroidetes bacterium]|nr:GIY-YIG nuclease family protein [Bacteroidota bacterium]MBS1630785.1 GIY-YIG nuclease family protein [Bacteroidota bacterium]